jgi:hypothetical protein
MGLDNYLLGTSAGVPSFSDQPSGGSARLVGLVRTNRNDGEPSEDVPTTFAVGAGPTPYDESGFVDLALISQAFGPIPSGIGISEKGDVIRVNTSAMQGPLQGGTY